MKQYKCIIEEYLPKGTILTLTQMDVGYENLTPYWAYSYAFMKDGRRIFGERTRREVEEDPKHYELVDNDPW